MDGFDFYQRRCESTFLTESRLSVKCNRVVDHPTDHSGWTPAGTYIKWTDAEAEKTKLKLIQKSTQPLLGWRAWKLAIDVAKLMSLTAYHVWDGPVCRSRAKPKAYDFDIGTDPYGVYCYKTPDLLHTHGLTAHRVFGSIYLSGRVVEHELGYRAEVATIKELWIRYTPLGADLIAKELEHFYACPVNVLKEDTNVGQWAYYMTKLQEDGEYK